MEINIDEDELKLLTYLHEKATGYGEEFSFEMETVTPALGWDQQTFDRVASYLAEWDLITAVTPTSGMPFFTLALTGQGENYMREFEKKLEERNLLSRGKQATVSTLKSLLDTGRDVVIKVATAVLTDYVKTHGGL